MNRLTSRGLVDLSCDRCNCIFQRPKNYVLSKISRRNSRDIFYCSHECSDLANSLPIRDCAQCGSPTKSKFCSNKCSATFNNHTRVRKAAIPVRLCEECGEMTKNPQFCGQSCFRAFREKRHIEDWKAGKESGMTPSGVICDTVRKYIFTKYGRQCAKCGWCEVNMTSGRVPVQIDHIDGDFRNCSEENLIVLCPNCHSLTPTYMTLNRGKGRDVNGVRRKKKVGIVQLLEHAPGTGETGVESSIPAPHFHGDIAQSARAQS